MIRITATVAGDPDVPPYERRFEFGSLDDGALVGACARVRDLLNRNRRVNINEALLMLAAFVATSLAEGRDGKEISRGAAGLLSPGQVMIGVPEMLRSIGFVVEDGGSRRTAALERPIRPGARHAP